MNLLEKYNISITDYNGSGQNYTYSEAHKNSNVYVTAMRMNIGFDLEFYVPEIRIFPFLSLNVATASLSSEKTNKNFLRYGSVISLATGFGFGLGKK